MSTTSTPSETPQQKSTGATVDVTQQFLVNASDYFQSEIKGMFISSFSSNLISLYSGSQ